MMLELQSPARRDNVIIVLQPNAAIMPAMERE